MTKKYENSGFCFSFSCFQMNNKKNVVIKPDENETMVRAPQSREMFNSTASFPLLLFVFAGYLCFHPFLQTSA